MYSIRKRIPDIHFFASNVDLTTYGHTHCPYISRILALFMRYIYDSGPTFASGLRNSEGPVISRGSFSIGTTIMRLGPTKRIVLMIVVCNAFQRCPEWDVTHCMYIDEFRLNYLY